MALHIVKRGETLSSIARLHGFENFETIWNDPGNDHLRKLREDPNALLEEDQLTIPDREEVVNQAASGGSHRFKVHVHRLKLRLKLLDLFGEKLANTACTLTVDGQTEDLTTDGDGFVEVEIERTSRAASLQVGKFEHELRIGELDPLPEPTGIDGRLRNLGYPLSDAQGLELLDELARREAIEFFQHDQGKLADGELTPDLVDALAKAHGC